jgi:hypothetical protein
VSPHNQVPHLCDGLIVDKVGLRARREPFYSTQNLASSHPDSAKMKKGARTIAHIAPVDGK